MLGLDCHAVCCGCPTRPHWEKKKSSRVRDSFFSSCSFITHGMTTPPLQLQFLVGQLEGVYPYQAKGKLEVVRQTSRTNHKQAKAGEGILLR
eukprot:2488575-Amphidinium_carterae.1